MNRNQNNTVCQFYNSATQSAKFTFIWYNHISDKVSERMTIDQWLKETRGPGWDIVLSSKQLVCPEAGEIMLKLPKDNTGMLTVDTLRQMYAEKLLEKNSWDDALYKVCWRSFTAGVFTGTQNLHELLTICRAVVDSDAGAVVALEQFLNKKVVMGEVIENAE